MAAVLVALTPRAIVLPGPRDSAQAKPQGAAGAAAGAARTATRQSAALLRRGDGQRHAQPDDAEGHAGHGVGDRRRDHRSPADAEHRRPGQVRAGVYIESNLTRVGLNGFNIRGIGGNRVMTQIDGVETVGAVRLRPVQRAPVPARSRHAEERRDRPQRRLVALRQRRARRRRLVLHEGSVRLSRRRRSTSAARRCSTAALANGSGNVVVAGGRGRVQASAFVSYDARPRARNKGTVETEGADAHRAQSAGPPRARGARQGDLRRLAPATCCAAPSKSPTTRSTPKPTRRACRTSPGRP